MAKLTDPIEPNDPNRLGSGKIPEKSISPAPDRSTFETFKEQAPSASQATPQSGITPMELSQKSILSQTPTFQTIQAQASNARDTLGDVEKNLKTPNLKLKKSQQELLNTKLKNSNQHLKDANEVLGAKVPKEQTASDSSNPAVRFLSYVSDGQNKLIEAQNQLKEYSNSDKKLKPADMLLVQVKLSQAQQEIEYSSVLLSKVVDSLKQIINIQL